MGASCCTYTAAVVRDLSDQRGDGVHLLSDDMAAQHSGKLPSAASARAERPPSARGRPEAGAADGGGYVTQQQLVDLISSLSDDGNPETSLDNGVKKQVMINVDLIETIVLEGEQAMGTKPSLGRKGTGFITMEQVAQAVERVSVDRPEDGEAEEDEASKEPRQTISRKPTGVVSKEQLLQALADISDDEEDESDDVAPAAARVGFERPLDREPKEPSGRRSSQIRKPTGAVSKEQLRQALADAGDEEDENDDVADAGARVTFNREQPDDGAVAAPRRRSSEIRRPTGAVSKEQLAHALADVSDDEDGKERDESAEQALPPPERRLPGGRGADGGGADGDPSAVRPNASTSNRARRSPEAGMGLVSFSKLRRLLRGLKERAT